MRLKVLEPHVLLVHHIFGSSKDNQLIVQLEKQSIESLIEWLTRLCDWMVKLLNTDGMRLNKDKRVEDLWVEDRQVSYLLEEVGPLMVICRPNIPQFVGIS